MAQPLKDSFGAEVPQWIGQRLAGTCPGLDTEAFVAECMVGYEDLELMPRARRIAEVMARHLPDDPHVAIPMVTSCIGPVDRSLTGMATMRYLPLTLYVGQVGLPAFEESMAAQYELTQRFSAEFSIRPFLRHDPERTLERLRQWASDPNEHVRRLVSEGTRPRLPWASRLEAFIDDPSPVLALLVLLRDDPSEYVRRSVANNLNDISKDHPHLVLDLAERWWSDGDQRRRRMLRHALRTLVKRGEPAALGILGHAPAPHVRVAAVAVEPAEVVIGDRVRISATLVDSRTPTPTTTPRESAQEVAVDFVVHFVKANGTTAPKVFTGGRRVVGPGDRITVTRSLSVAQMSTRTHYPGPHRVEVQVNGTRVAAPGFVLLPAPDDGSAAPTS